MLDLESQSMMYAKKSIDFCLTPENIDIPEDKFNWEPGCSILVYGRLRMFTINMLGLERSYLEENREASTTVLQNAWKNVLKWTLSGQAIIFNEAGDNYRYFPFSRALELFYEKNIESPFVTNNINQAFYLLCLNELAGFIVHYRQSYVEKSELDSNIKPYKTSIDAIGHLLCAQEAFECAQTHSYRIAGHVGLERLKEENKQMRAMAKFGRGKPEIDKRNKREADKAENKWVPHVKEVFNLMSARKISKSHAAKIVADKHELNHGTLLNNTTKYKDKTNYL